MMYSGRTDSYNQIALTTEITPVDVLEMSTNAIYQSVAINPTDKLLDPVHYSLGMWGKLIILGTVKLQGASQHVDPERNIHELNWESIFRNVYSRTHLEMQYLLTASSCYRWYEYRLRVYKDRFPAYYLYGTMIDQLICHYSTVLFTLIECFQTMGKDWHLFYWENLHSSPLADIVSLNHSTQHGADRSFENMLQKLIKCSSMFCTVGTRKSVLEWTVMQGPPKSEGEQQKKGRNSSGNFNHTAAKKRAVVNQSAESLKFNAQASEADIKPKVSHSMNDFGIGSTSLVIEGVSCQGPLHVVVEHNVPQKCAPSMELTSGVKRVHSQDDEHTSEGLKKRPKLNETDKQLLLSVLWKFKEAKCALCDIFQAVEQWVADKPCEYTVSRIEERVRSGEIVDIKDLMNNCLCLISIYALSQNERKIPNDVRKLMDSLRKAYE